jgi:hypothetical protein
MNNRRYVQTGIDPDSAARVVSIFEERGDMYRKKGSVGMWIDGRNIVKLGGI